MRTWIVYYTADEYELPVYVGDTLQSVADWLQMPVETLKTAFKRHGIYKGKVFSVERVQMPK